MVRTVAVEFTVGVPCPGRTFEYHVVEIERPPSPTVVTCD
jgi:hypothetical protein